MVDASEGRTLQPRMAGGSGPPGASPVGETMKAVRISGILWMAVALASSAPVLAKPASWPQSYHDSGHTGFNKKEKTLSAGNVAGLQLVWGQSQDNCQTFADVYDQGTLYLVGQESDCSTFNIQALDAATGAVKWDVPVGNPGGGSPTVATGNGLVFTGCEFFDTQLGRAYGAICALSQTDGSLVWQDSNPCNCLPEAGIQAQPVYANGIVYYGYANGGAGANEYIVAADANTGVELWTYVTGGPNTLGTAAPAVANGAVYFACSPVSARLVCALSANDGSLLWQSAIPSNDTVYSLVAAGDRIYADVCGTNALVALDAATGGALWTNSTLECNGASLVAVAGGYLYYAKPGGELDKLKAKNGKVKWTAGSPNVPTGPASVANGVVYVPGGPNAGRSTGASAYDARTGALLWNSNFSGDSYGIPPPPIVVNGVVYEANDSSCGSLCAYALPGALRR